MCGMPRCRACSGGFFEQQLPAGAQHAGDHGDGLLPLGHVVDDAEVDNGVVAGARLLDVADFAGRKRHSAPVQASARELDHGLVEVDRRHPSPTGTTCNSVSTTCAATSAAHRGLSNATTTTTSSASKLTALKGQKTATSRGTSWSSTSTRKPSSWAAHLRQAARARTHRRGRRGRSDGRQRPDDVVVG